MNNPENRAQYINGPEMIKRWILDLASKKQTTREKARSFLAASGDSALDALIDSFSSPNSSGGKPEKLSKAVNSIGATLPEKRLWTL
jgi:hypothetical protein